MLRHGQKGYFVGPKSVAQARFVTELISSGEEIIRLRRELVPKFAPIVSAGYRRLAADGEELGVSYHGSVKQDFRVELAQSQARERAYRLTLIGPHRDE